MNAKAVAQQDLIEGFASFRAWTTLAVDDLKARYARTLIGPFWMTIAHGFFVFGYAYWSSVILKQPLTEQLPYVAVGLTVWFWISSSLVEAGGIYLRASSLITAYDLPVSLHIHRAVAGQFFGFLHNMIIAVIALVVAEKSLGLEVLLAIPGIIVLYLVCIAWSLSLGLLGLRYRDVAPLIGSIVGVFFILTPIFWSRADVQQAQWMADWNPFYHLIEIVREPLLGGVPTLTNWIVSLSILVILMGVGAIVFITNRNRLTYWL